VFGYGFSDYDGSPTTITYPAGDGLATETVTAGYDAASGLPTTLSTNLPNVSSYVSTQQYSAYGEPTLTSCGRVQLSV
jgi:hypothetical protein